MDEGGAEGRVPEPRAWVREVPRGRHGRGREDPPRAGPVGADARASWTPTCTGSRARRSAATRTADGRGTATASPYALVDCPDHEPGEPALAFENVLSGTTPTDTHDTVGWPTFADWPARPRSPTRTPTTAGSSAPTAAACASPSCCSSTTRSCARCGRRSRTTATRWRASGARSTRLKELQDYVDAQAGGPGRGWMRIVRTPFQARRVINRGKLAVVMGLEMSRLFDCRVIDGVPSCTKDEHRRRASPRCTQLGVRSLEITGKFDNALSGVAGDPGTNGVVTNSGNRLETGALPRHADRARACRPAPSTSRSCPRSGRWASRSPRSCRATTPAYPPPPHCNQLGLLRARRAPGQPHRRHGACSWTPTTWPPRRASPRSTSSQSRGYSGVLSSPLLEHAGRRAAHPRARRRRLPEGVGHRRRPRRRTGSSASTSACASCATRATSSASASARTPTAIAKQPLGERGRRA